MAHTLNRRRQLSRRAFLSRATALGMSAATARTLVGAPQAKAQTPATRNVARIAMPLPPLGDPRHAVRFEAANVWRGWLEYLVEYQADGAFVGVLLDGWEVEDGARRYRLTLRPGVTWSNGDSFTAANVAHSLERWCDARDPLNSMAVRLAALIDPETRALRQGGVEVVDDRTLVLNLAWPDTTLIAGLADYPAAVVHPSYAGGDPWDAPIGTGPYLPTGSYQTGVSAALEARSDWWGRDVVGGPHLSRIQFTDVGPDRGAEVRALNAGEVDLLAESSGFFTGILDAQSYPKSTLASATSVVIRARAAADFDGFAPYDLPEVRQALALAVDQEAVLALALDGAGALGANHHVAPIQRDYAEIGAPRLAPAEARSVLDTVGVLGFPHQLITPATPWVADCADVIAAQMNDAGLSVDRVTLDDAAFWADWRAHPLAATPWVGRPFGLQTLALGYSSDSPWNETGFASDEFDAKLIEAAGLDPADRLDQMGELQGMLLAEGLIVQPVWRDLSRHTRRPMVGAEAHPSGELHLYKLGFAA